MLCESTVVNKESALNVSGVYVSVFPLLKFLTNSPYTIDQAHLQNLIARLVFSLIKKDIAVLLIPSEQQSIAAATLGFVPRFTQLQKRL